MKDVHVVIGIIIHEGNVLIAKRPEEKHQGGVWEFPGGKVKNKEKSYDALVRELNEEVGIVPQKARPLIKFSYKYPDQTILLDVWIVRRWQKRDSTCEQQEIHWIKFEDITGYRMPPANKVIINAIRLPSLYLVSPGLTISVQDYLNKIKTCLEAGVKLLQLRCGDTVFDSHPDLIYKIIDLCNFHGSKVLLNGSPEKAELFNAHGVHLSGNRLKQLDKRPLDYSKYVAASCHNKHELKHACDIGVDFIVLSPVIKTRSHPDSKPLGWKRFSTMVQNISVPVFALGGMKCSDMEIAWEHGAQGVAIQRHIWQAENSADNVRKCLENN